MVSLSFFNPPTPFEVTILLSHNPTKSPHSAEATISVILISGTHRCVQGWATDRSALLMLMLSMPPAKQQANSAKLWRGTLCSSSCAGVGALFNACCLKRQMEVYIFTFPALFLALLSPPTATEMSPSLTVMI